MDVPRGHRMLPAAIALVGALVLPMFRPSFLVAAVCVAVGAAIIGTYQSAPSSRWEIVRATLLALSAFGFPLFLGGRAIPWIAAATAMGVLVAWWWANDALRARLAFVQVLIAALGIGLSATATGFFFPAAWGMVTAATAVTLTALLVAVAPERMLIRWVPSADAIAALLIIGETILVLRVLPLHWIVSGAMLACTALCVLEHARISRAAMLTLTAFLLVFGMTL